MSETKRTPRTIRMSDVEVSEIEAQFERFERERPGQVATFSQVIRTLALEWARRSEGRDDEG